MYAELEKVLAGVGKGGGETAAIEAIHTIAEATPKRSLIVLFSDMLDRSQDLDAIFAALAHLRHAKHEVVVFHVLDEKTEQRFDFADRPTTFIDLESGEEVRANPAEVREAYVSKMAALRRDLDVRCGSAGIDWVDVDHRERGEPCPHGLPVEATENALIVNFLGLKFSQLRGLSTFQQWVSLRNCE